MRVRLVPGDSIMCFVWSRVGTAGREHERREKGKKKESKLSGGCKSLWLNPAPSGCRVCVGLECVCAVCHWKDALRRLKNLQIAMVTMASLPPHQSLRPTHRLTTFKRGNLWRWTLWQRLRMSSWRGPVTFFFFPVTPLPPESSCYFCNCMSYIRVCWHPFILFTKSNESSCVPVKEGLQETGNGGDA